jgi:hypothetical protein
MKKEQPFVWGKEQDAAIVKLKEALSKRVDVGIF